MLDHRDIRHPELGAVRVFLVRRSTFLDSTGCVAAVTGSGRALASADVDIYENELRFATPATDATGNTFVIYNPGRYDGVLVLVPNADGFEDIGWSGTTEHYSCTPSCAQGVTTQVTLRWNGHDYLPVG